MGAVSEQDFAHGDLPNINEIVFFLNEYAPSIARELGRKGEDYAGLLNVGVLGGENESIDEDLKRKLNVQSEILSAALDQTITKAEERSEQIKGKLKKLRKLRFFVGVCSAIGATGAAGTALMGEKTYTIFLSLVTLASNIVNEASITLILGSDGKELDLIETLRALARAISFANITRRHLAIISSSGFSNSEVTDLLKQANAQYRELNEALNSKLVF